MSDKSSADNLDRRKFLGAAGLAGAALAATPAIAIEAAKPDPLITEVQDWQRYLGDGVDKRPYGVPSKFEKNVIRRHVAWLTASPESSVNFTPLHSRRIRATIGGEGSNASMSAEHVSRRRL